MGRAGAGGIVPTDMIAGYNHLLVEYDLLSDMLDAFDAEDRERLAPSMEKLVAAADARRGTPGTPAPTPSG